MLLVQFFSAQKKQVYSFLKLIKEIKNVSITN